MRSCVRSCVRCCVHGCACCGPRSCVHGWVCCGRRSCVHGCACCGLCPCAHCWRACCGCSCCGPCCSRRCSRCCRLGCGAACPMRRAGGSGCCGSATGSACGGRRVGGGGMARCAVRGAGRCPWRCARVRSVGGAGASNSSRRRARSASACARVGRGGLTPPLRSGPRRSAGAPGAAGFLSLSVVIVGLDHAPRRADLQAEVAMPYRAVGLVAVVVVAAALDPATRAWRAVARRGGAAEAARAAAQVLRWRARPAALPLSARAGTACRAHGG